MSKEVEAAYVPPISPKSAHRKMRDFINFILIFTDNLIIHWKSGCKEV